MTNTDDKNSLAPTPQSSEPRMPRRRRWPVIIIATVFLLFILGGVGGVGASLLEEHDSFCAACHTTPELTYVDRAAAALTSASAAVPDLASIHYQLTQAKNISFACIDCHRGDSSLSQRVQTLALGGRDAVIWVTGRGDPTIEKTVISNSELPNAACVSCHTDTLLTANGTSTHFHNWLPQTAQLIAQGKQLITNGNGRRSGEMRNINTDLTCTSCHLAHKTVNSVPALKMVDTVTAQQTCDACHKAAGERPQSIDRLLNGGEG